MVRVVPNKMTTSDSTTKCQITTLVLLGHLLAEAGHLQGQVLLLVDHLLVEVAILHVAVCLRREDVACLDLDLVGECLQLATAEEMVHMVSERI